MKKETGERDFSFLSLVMFMVDKVELYNILEGLREVLEAGITTKELYPPRKILRHSSIVAEEYINFFMKLADHEEENIVSLNIFFKN